MIPEIVPLFRTLLTVSFKASLLILAILLIRALIGNRLSPAWRHALWGIVPLQLLLFFSIPSSWSVYNLLPQKTDAPEAVVETHQHETIPVANNILQPATTTQAVSTQQPPVTLSHDSEVHAASEPPPMGITTATVLQCLVAVWLAGCVIMFLIFLRQTLLCRRWMHGAEQIENESVLRLFKDCAKRMNIRTWLVLAESRSVCGPLLVGAIRPTLLLPHGLVESATPEQLRSVFLHELAHLKRWDVWTGWLMTFLLSLHWFNPLLWFAVRKINADREEACDAMALQSLGADERPAYGHALIDIAQHFVTPTRTPGLVGISETGKHLKRRIEMISHTKTWKLRWKILALVAVLFLGVTTMTDAQTTKRSAAEIQAEIERLQGELADTKKTENAVAPQPADGRQPSDKDGAAKNLARYSGDYIGTEGDDRIGIRIGTPEKNVYPITIYEDGLPGKGYDPKDDDKYVGTASFSDGKFEIRLMKKFDGRKEEKVESALQALTATFQPIDAKIDSKGFYLTIPRNREWDAVRVAPVPAKPESKSLTTSDSLPGDYLGWEDDDRIGIRIGKPAQPSGEFPVTIYENGLPGRGHDPNDDDRYEGVATFKAGNLEITLTKKFDENVEESVERALRKLTARTGLENNKPTLFIPANREWKDVKVTKGGE